MNPRGALLTVLLVSAAVLAGCIAGDDPEEPVDDLGPEDLTSVHTRHLLPFDTSGDWSVTLEEGLFDLLPVESVFIDVDLPLHVAGAALTGDAVVHMGIFRPDVPDGVRVPVIADVGPYYGDGDVAATEPANRLGRFLIENFVQHGYAVAQVSVFGSGQSTHCMDLMGESEQLGIDAAVTYLGEQDWSNGNVGLIGRSYDGSTPWQAAMFGNPHLKTIVPISGLIGMHELMWYNGSAETRAPIMHNVVYGTFGMDPDKHPVNYLCRDYLLGPVVGAGATVTGDHFFPEVNHYWEDRYFLDRALANYQGSVYFIHGLQDWNVNPHMAFPTHQMLIDAGIEVKGLYGQWGHHYPDRPNEHQGLPQGRGAEAYPESVRWDWAQDLLEWFDHYLMETGSKPPLHVEVQDHRGTWRVEDTYPPKDLDWKVLDFATDIQRTQGDGLVHPNAEQTRYEFGPFDEDVRLAGLARLHVTVTPTGPGGQIFVEMRDKTEDLRLGHAIMDLRYHEGGRDPVTVVPGMPILARMEFQAMDVVIPAGHVVELRVSNTGMGYLPSVVSTPTQIEETADSVLKLPVRHPEQKRFFMPPVGPGTD